MTKKNYPLEDQINACYKLLGKPHKDAWEMDESELSLAEQSLRMLGIRWQEHPDYVQSVPIDPITGEIIT